MYTRLTCLLLCCCLLSSCQNSPDLDPEKERGPDSPQGSRDLTRGDHITLMKPLSFAKLQSHTLLQFGRVIMWHDLRPYEISCIIDNDRLGPHTIQPQRYRVSKVTFNEEMYSDASATIRYYHEFKLKSDDQQPGLLLTCQELGGTMEYHDFPVHKIEQATGDYFAF